MKHDGYARNATCFLCGTQAHQDSGATAQIFFVVCGICGNYRLDRSAYDLLHNLSQSEDGSRYEISNQLRVISEEALGKRDNSYFPISSAVDLEKMLNGQDPSVPEKQRTLLNHLGRLTKYPGQSTGFDNSNETRLRLRIEAILGKEPHVENLI
jgi:hypothetical protein